MEFVNGQPAMRGYVPKEEYAELPGQYLQAAETWKRARPRPGAFSKSLHKIGDFDAQSVSDDFQRLNCYVAFAAFDLPDVCPVQPGAIGKYVLRPATLLPQGPDSIPDLLLNILHLQQFRGTLALSIQVITCGDGG
jgi:hypothetical protein